MVCAGQVDVLTDGARVCGGVTLGIVRGREGEKAMYYCFSAE